jgi:hypothetical protein
MIPTMTLAIMGSPLDLFARPDEDEHKNKETDGYSDKKKVCHGSLIFVELLANRNEDERERKHDHCRDEERRFMYESLGENVRIKSNAAGQVGRDALGRVLAQKWKITSVTNAS